MARVVLTAAYARAYVDVNREAYELDPSMFEDELPDFARGRSARVGGGFGLDRPHRRRGPGDLRPQTDLR